MYVFLVLIEFDKMIIESEVFVKIWWKLVYVYDVEVRIGMMKLIWIVII